MTAGDGQAVSFSFCSGGSPGGVVVEGLAEGGGRGVEVSVDPTDLLGGFTHTGCAPAQRHMAVAPALHNRGVIAADPDHLLDGVR